MPENSIGLSMDRRSFVGLGATAAISAAIFLAGWDTRDAYADGTETVLTIVHTNDVHSYVDVLPYVKGLVDSLKASGSNVELVSAGDDFAGTPFATLSAGQDVATAMNMAEYDRITIGNHEYMMSAANFKAVVDAVNFSVVACNPLPTTLSDNPSIQPYEIVEVDGVKVAFIGIGYNQPGAPDMLTSINAAKAAAEVDGAKVFIGISHLGVTDANDQNRSTYIADNCDWFTLIVDGHSHTTLPTGQMRNGVLIVQTGEYGNNIGVTEVTIDSSTGDVTSAIAKLIPIKGQESTCGIVPDAGITAFIAQVNEKNAYINEVVFTTTGVLVGDRQSVRTQETSLGNLVADAMRVKAGTDVALASGASLRSDLGPGDVTRGELQTALLAETEIARIEITGADLLALLEDGFSSYPDQYFLFPHISGMSVAFDSALPVGSRIVYAALLDGRVIDPADTYSVAVRADIVDAYLPGITGPVEGSDYTLGFGIQSEAVIEYATSGITLNGEIDGRLRVRGQEYLIKFDGNGASSGSMNDITASYDQAVTLPALSFVHSGFVFKGWMDDLGVVHDDGETADNFDIAALGVVTLKAQWEALAEEVVVSTPEPGGSTKSPILPKTADGSSLYAAAAVLAASAAGTVAVASKLKKEDADTN